ncbi:CoA-transferase family III [Rhizoclosmatium globosum]|uniref:CoA-transferase family III n=1 Tax=Rhizoclosmatium globosum TaxID=329046 RepID=A0A1Y2CUX1_9FUNG|nr:CoA-transferase family III [Rhizoclosmatium globosum]|eukprot:ORY50838.1 CoA-transferase family III [Rhizoclosmatium globosum]
MGQPLRSGIQSQAITQLEMNGSVCIVTSPPTNPNSPPLKNLRILDLTRVLAGPLCCKTLASQGASIIHISSPTLPNLGPLDLCTLVGKKSLHIDLKTPTGRSHFTTLLRNADVLVQSYRPDALHNLGFSPTELFTINPRLIITNISAYGIPTPTAATTFTNPWKARRGFDSLVQMATGICHESSKTGAPVPLPCQALDHATGWLAACGILEAVQRGFGGVSVDVSLVRTSVWLESLGRKKLLIWLMMHGRRSCLVVRRWRKWLLEGWKAKC